MLKNYFLIAWRNLLRRPLFTALNLGGICAAILFVLLIGAFAASEWNVNRALRNVDRLYYLNSEWRNPEQGVPITTLGPLAKALKQEYPGLVGNFYRGDYITSVVSHATKNLREHIDIGDSTFLSIFGFGLLYGDASTAMKNPFSVVIKKEIALKYFGRADVVGETLGIQNFSNQTRPFLITGVLKDVPENSVTDLNFENHHALFIPANTASFFKRDAREDWASTWYPSFVELRAGVTPKDLEAPIKQLIHKYAPDVQQDLTVHAMAMKDYHLVKDNKLVQRTLYALCFTGLFILLMAVVNFVNISISSSTDRIKEVGVRKVLGGLRREIIGQFLIESILLVFLAAGLALLLYPIARPGFSGLVGKEIPLLSEFSPLAIGGLVASVLLLGLLAGLYPAFVLSALKSADSIKGRLRSVSEHIWLRKILAGFQFCLACIVIIAAVVVTRQIAYFFGQDLGYQKEYVVSSQVPRDWTPEGVTKMQAVRDQFARLPEVAQVSLAYEIPDGMNQGRGPVYRAEQDSTHAVVAQFMETDEYYVDVYQVRMKAGTFLTSAMASDPTKVVINEAGIKALGWKTPEEALGRKMRFVGFPDVCTIAGITADYHFSSMQQKIPPIIYGHVKLFNTYRYLSFRLRPGNVGAAIKSIEKKWASVLPGSSFEYRFMDETLRLLYKSELQLQRAAYVATFLSLLIVLLGVTAFVSMSIRKRTKEIGIRKVLGASVGNIMGLFVKDFLWVLVLAGLIACPIAWTVMHQWLDSYAYRISLTAVPFIASVLALMAVTLGLIVFQTAKAGNMSPVKSLKTE
ncbi:MAG: ABC transporter permease [Bacteroidetes bacterium]|nr:ABC transporter permease [Bacteroidota bacterium]